MTCLFVGVAECFKYFMQYFSIYFFPFKCGALANYIHFKLLQTSLNSVPTFNKPTCLPISADYLQVGKSRFWNFRWSNVLQMFSLFL